LRGAANEDKDEARMMRQVMVVPTDMSPSSTSDPSNHTSTQKVDDAMKMVTIWKMA